VSIVGYLLILSGAIWFGYKLYLSYSSAGGTDFMLPVYDGAIYPPMLAAFGLYWVLRGLEIEWSYWAYVGLWLGLSVLAGAAIWLSEEIGDRTL
jgi:hypothetical protein